MPLLQSATAAAVVLWCCCVCLADGDAETPTLAAQVDRYLEQLDAAAVITGNQGRLGLRVSLYENAWKTHALRHLQSELRKRSAADQDHPVDDIIQQLLEQKKQRRALQSKSCFRLTLSHPQAPDEDSRERVSEKETVHYFLQSLPDSIRMRLGKGVIPWQVLEVGDNLKPRKVRVARHHTAKRGRRVPYVSALKPEKPRVVFRGESAECWGVFSKALFRKKQGVLTYSVAFEEYHGKYDGQHIVDLNEASHVFEQDQTLTASRALPFLFPLPPPAVEEFLTKVTP